MVILDKKDKKLLFELSQNSRQTNKEIAKKIGLSEPSTAYRINRLMGNKIIEHFYVITNNAKLGYFHYKIFLRAAQMNEETEKMFIKGVKENKNVIWFVSTRGNYDYVISILAKDIHEFSTVYKQVTEKFGSNILQRNVCVVEKAGIYSRGYLLNQVSKEHKYGMKEEAIILDDDDKRLLQVISTNARMPSVEIARELRISADKVIYRMKKLIGQQFLLGFGTKLTLKNLNIKQYLVSFKFQNFSEQKYNILKEIAKKNQSLQYFISIIGDHDLELELEVQDTEQVDNVFREIKRFFTNELRGYEILEITEEYKLNYFPF
ncbi:Lrp/AsnC family transcriptional regulator [Candidatus Woesearchaeota archaeon]|nr:Lrp/AsnC family transcriptional regulator [Candidatus Woesearchaeota archaeon]